MRDMLTAKYPVEKAVIGQEKHQDGNLHLHAYVKFHKRVAIRDSRACDIEWEGK